MWILIVGVLYVVVGFSIAPIMMRTGETHLMVYSSLFPLHFMIFSMFGNLKQWRPEVNMPEYTPFSGPMETIIHVPVVESPMKTLQRRYKDQLSQLESIGLDKDELEIASEDLRARFLNSLRDVL